MGFYIWFNADGTESRREAKGRGKPKLGAIRQENGDYHFAEAPSTASVAVQPKMDITGPMEQVPVTEAVQPEKKPSNQRVITASVKIDLREMLKGLHISGGCFLEEEDFITIIRPDVIVETLGIPEFHCRYCSYARFLINKLDGSLQVWILRTSGDPDYIIKNAFTEFE